MFFRSLGIPTFGQVPDVLPKRTWYLKWNSTQGEFRWKWITEWSKSSHLIHRDRRLFCCWDWSTICHCSRTRRNKNSSAQQTRSSSLTLTKPVLWIGTTGDAIAPPFIHLICLPLLVAAGYPRLCSPVFTLNMKFQLAANKTTLPDWASEVSWTWTESHSTLLLDCSGSSVGCTGFILREGWFDQSDLEVISSVSANSFPILWPILHLLKKVQTGDCLYSV